MGQGQPSVIVNIHFVELENTMFHAKFHNYKTISSVGEGVNHIWARQPSWSCNLDYLYIYIYFLSQFSRRLNMKSDFDWPSGSRGEDV